MAGNRAGWRSSSWDSWRKVANLCCCYVASFPHLVPPRPPPPTTTHTHTLTQLPSPPPLQVSALFANPWLEHMECHDLLAP
jgi:hypothetical protein